MPWALCIFVLGSLSVLIFIMGTIIKEMMQIQFLALNLWVCIMLDLNGFSSVSYQGILVKYLFFFQRKKKKPWERKTDTSPPFPSWKRCCEVRMNTRAGLGVEMSLRAWAGYSFWARQQGPVNGSTGHQTSTEIQPISQCFCRRQQGPPWRVSALGTAVTSAGKLSLFKPEGREECGLPGRDLLRVDS